MKSTADKTNTPKIQDVSSFNIASAFRFYRNKKGDSQAVFAEELNKVLKTIDESQLSPELKKEYAKLKDKAIIQQLVSEWEAPNSLKPISKLYAYLASIYFNIGLEWLTDYSYDPAEGASFVQQGGVCYNNWHHNVINHSPEAIIQAYNDSMDRVERAYKEILKMQTNG